MREDAKNTKRRILNYYTFDPIRGQWVPLMARKATIISTHSLNLSSLPSCDHLSYNRGYRLETEGIESLKKVTLVKNARVLGEFLCRAHSFGGNKLSRRQIGNDWRHREASIHPCHAMPLSPLPASQSDITRIEAVSVFVHLRFRPTGPVASTASPPTPTVRWSSGGSSRGSNAVVFAPRSESHAYGAILSPRSRHLVTPNRLLDRGDTPLEATILGVGGLDRGVLSPHRLHVGAVVVARPTSMLSRLHPHSPAASPFKPEHILVQHSSPAAFGRREFCRWCDLSRKGESRLVLVHLEGVLIESLRWS
eukprot:Gb_12400 [translate_table: standard]